MESLLTELSDGSVVALELGTTLLDVFVVVDVVAEPGVPIVAVLAWLAERPSGVSDCDHDSAHSDTLERGGLYR